MPETYDAVVTGAGVFGAWTALCLRRTGRSVALLDAYGAGNSRSSSGGESRILRMGYGPDEIYTRWAWRSRQLWLEFFDQVKRPELFQSVGVLWTPPPGDPRLTSTLAVFEKCGVASQLLAPEELEQRFPQFRFSSPRAGILEPDSGVILARRAVQALVVEAVRQGVDYFVEGALAGDNSQVQTHSGRVLRAAAMVYACGPWLPKIFPRILQDRIRATRQEVFFFGPPAGNRSFAPPRMPVWIDITDQHGAYTVPDLESRGFKLAFDRHGPEFDPDTSDRAAHGLDAARAFLAERFPDLAHAPLLEARVCQYENTSSGDFLIDQHPEFERVWLVGGGSGHGFKHGPAVGEYVVQRIEGRAGAEPRFSLAAKGLHPQRAVF